MHFILLLKQKNNRLTCCGKQTCLAASPHFSCNCLKRKQALLENNSSAAKHTYYQQTVVQICVAWVLLALCKISMVCMVIFLKVYSNFIFKFAVFWVILVKGSHIMFVSLYPWHFRGHSHPARISYQAPSVKVHTLLMLGWKCEVVVYPWWWM